MTNTPMTSREAFEQWHKSEYQGHNSYSYKHDTTAYIDDYVEIAFMAWQASQAQQASVVVELQAEVQRLHTGDNLKALLDEDTDALMKSCNEMHKTVLERDKTIAELVEALDRNRLYWRKSPYANLALDALAKVKGK